MPSKPESMSASSSEGSLSVSRVPGGPPVSPPPRDNAPRAAPSPKPVLPEASPAKETAAPSAAYLLLKPYLFRPLGILPFWRSTSNHPVPVKLSEPWTGKTPPYPKGPQCPPHQAASAPQDKPLLRRGIGQRNFVPCIRISLSPIATREPRPERLNASRKPLRKNSRCIVGTYTIESSDSFCMIHPL